MRHYEIRKLDPLFAPYCRSSDVRQWVFTAQGLEKLAQKILTSELREGIDYNITIIKYRSTPAEFLYGSRSNPKNGQSAKSKKEESEFISRAL